MVYKTGIERAEESFVHSIMQSTINYSAPYIYQALSQGLKEKQ